MAQKIPDKMDGTVLYFLSIFEEIYRYVFLFSLAVSHSIFSWLMPTGKNK
jgi:hypothetical protein